MMRAVHPGEILSEELGELGVSPSELARQLQVPANRITQIVRGQRMVTGDTALRLGHWFDTSAEFWLNLQLQYDLAVARQKIGNDLQSLRRRSA
jgi:addiction module HigA family antidote